MKLRIALAASAVLVLSACGKSENTEAAAAASSEAAAPAAAETSAAATAAPAAAAAAAGSAPTNEFMVGKWAEEGDCELALEFKADGSMDGPFENWKLDNGVLSMGDNPQKSHLTVVDAETMEARRDGTGEPRKLTRCK